MKKRIFMLIFVCVFFFTACTQMVDTEEITETMETTQITETSETTEIKQTPVHIEIVRGKPLQTESPELQERIAVNQDNGANHMDCKVILTIGTHTDIPYLDFGESEWLTEIMYSDNDMEKTNAWQGGWWFNRMHSWDRTCYNEAHIKRDEENLPIYRVNGEEAFSVFANDIMVEVPIEILIDRENGNYQPYETIDEMCNDLESGRHYARIKVTCYGDTLLVDGNEEFTEWLGAYYFFVIEIE